jgi:hypothetical protein
MSKLRTFYKTLIRSLTDPDYYDEVVKANFWFSVKYFLVFIFLFSALLTALFTFRTKPKLESLTKNTINDLNTNFPKNLVISISKGQMSLSGANPPLNVPIPSYLTSIFQYSPYQYLISIDPINPPNPKAMMGLSKTTFIANQPDGSKEEMSLSELKEEDLTIDRNFINMSTSALQTWIDRFWSYLPLFVFISLVLVLPISVAILLIFLSILTWMLGQILSKNLSYLKSYQIGLHTITFALTVGFLQNLLLPSLSPTKFLGLAFIGASTIILWTIRPVKIRK